MKEVEIYDLECFPNFFSFTGVNRDTSKLYTYYLFNNDNIESPLDAFKERIRGLSGMIGYNVVNYDYPILHQILLGKISTNEEIYKLSKSIVNNEKIWIKDRDIIVPQLDLFKIWHYDNRARSTSLKDLECALNWYNVQDLPLPYDHIVQEDEIPMIMDYNLNDVLATQEFLSKSLDKIELRKNLTKMYGINCMNFSDSKIGEQLVLHLYCKETNSNPWEVKQLRTHRDSIDLNDVILPEIQFKSKEFNNLLNILKL